MMADIWAYKTVPITHTPVEREIVVHDFYKLVRPLDGRSPDQDIVKDPQLLQAKTVDPEVIQVDWYVDGKLIAKDGGGEFRPPIPTLGRHTVRAHAFDRVINHAFSDRNGGKPDSLDWVRDFNDDMQQDASWTVDVTKTLSIAGRNAGRHPRRSARAYDLERAGRPVRADGRMLEKRAR
jgi:hypothetical protein